jgi:predicted nucleotidyltransferase
MKRPQYDLIPIEDLKEKISEMFESHGEIIVSYLYGSYAQGYQTKFSDIDVGVLLREDFQESPLYFAELGSEIEKEFNYRINVDVKILNEKPPRFLFQVLKHGILLYCRDPTSRDEFEVKVITQYLDIKPLLNHFDNLFLREVNKDEG